MAIQNTANFSLIPIGPASTGEPIQTVLTMHQQQQPLRQLASLCSVLTFLTFDENEPPTSEEAFIKTA